MLHGTIRLPNENVNRLYLDADFDMYESTTSEYTRLFTHQLCPECHIEKPNSMFPIDENEPDGIRMVCKKCISKYVPYDPDEGKVSHESKIKANKKEYSLWANIKQQCTNPKNPQFKNYGAHGIGMYVDWRNDFAAFKEYISALDNYDMPGYSLDRIDNEGDYEPGNLRWATSKQQMQNTRNTRINLETVLDIRHMYNICKMKKWKVAEALGISESTVYHVSKYKSWKNVEEEYPVGLA